MEYQSVRLPASRIVLLPLILEVAALLLSPILLTSSAADGDFRYLYLPLVTKTCIISGIPVVNGDFEQGAPGWTMNADAQVISTSQQGITPHNGTMMGYLNSSVVPGAEGAGLMSQTVQVPECGPYLHFWRSSQYTCAFFADTCGNILTITVNGEPYGQVGIANNLPWSEAVVDLSAFAGQTVSIGFTVILPPFSAWGFGGTSTYLDDIAFDENP